MAREFHSFKVEAVVLRHNDWGEADRILGLFTREQGKLRVIAKGARKIRSRKAGHLEPFTRITVMLAKSHDLPIVTQVETIDAHLPLHEDLILTSYASYLIELLDRFTFEEGENEPLYNLLVDSLSRLEPPTSAMQIANTTSTPYENTWLPLRFYEIKLLEILGYRPELIHCTNCKEEIKPQDQYFDGESGGVLCPNCGPLRTRARRVSMEALKYFRYIQRSNYEQALRAHPTPMIQDELETLIQYYLTYLLERDLKSTAFIKEVGRTSLQHHD